VLYGPDEEFPVGGSRVVREGGDVTLVGCGITVHQALEAAEALAAENVSVEVVDLRSILPWDRETVAASVVKTNKVVVCHEDSRTGGVGAEVAAFIAEELFEDLDGPILRVAALDTPVPFSPHLEEAVIPGTRHIVDAVRRLAAY
jgi:2-oxoisovalerate dehydrogenase E1 component beta subunit